MEAYESETQQNDRIVMGAVDVERQREKAEGLLELLNHWISKAHSNSRPVGNQNDALQELARENASGRLWAKIGEIRSSIEMLSTGAETRLLDQLASIEENIRYMV